MSTSFSENGSRRNVCDSCPCPGILTCSSMVANLATTSADLLRLIDELQQATMIATRLLAERNQPSPDWIEGYWMER